MKSIARLAATNRVLFSLCFAICGCYNNSVDAKYRDVRLSAVITLVSPESQSVDAKSIFEPIAKEIAKVYGARDVAITYRSLAEVRREGLCKIGGSPLAIWIKADTFSSSESPQFDGIVALTHDCRSPRRRELGFIGASHRFKKSTLDRSINEKRYKFAAAFLIARIKNQRKWSFSSAMPSQ